MLRSLRARSALRSPRTSLPSRGPRALRLRKSLPRSAYARAFRAPPTQEPSALPLRLRLRHRAPGTCSGYALQALAPATRSRHLLRLRLLPPRPPRAPRAPRVWNHFRFLRLLAQPRQNARFARYLSSYFDKNDIYDSLTVVTFCKHSTYIRYPSVIASLSIRYYICIDNFFV